MKRTFVSVDVEASGPAPPRYSMLALGACIVGHDDAPRFYAELVPLSDEIVPEAMAVHDLTIEQLRSSGQEPAIAMDRLRGWLAPWPSPTFVGLNAAFDWGYVNAYLHMYGEGSNPFGFAPIDIKALAMGVLHVPWEATRSSVLAARLGVTLRDSHHALHDAEDQAALFEALLRYGNRRKRGSHVSV